MSEMRRVGTSYYRQFIDNKEENAYGTVVIWDEANQKDVPVICMHGGSMWLCPSCADAIVEEQCDNSLEA